MRAVKAKANEPVQLDHLRVHNITAAECVNTIVRRATNGQGGWLLTPNADILRQVYKDPALRRLVADADIVVADGMPLLWASRLKGTPLCQRICGSDLVWTVADAAANHKLSIFLLGGGLPDTAERAADSLRRRSPLLKIAGTHYPPFGFESRPDQIQEIKTRLSDAQPDIVYVALGFPRAERLIAQLRCEHPEVWWLGVGISLSFICGEVRRAPPWMQSIGLEWVHRLMQEPGRLAKRYLWHDIPYVFGLLARSAVARFREHGSA